MYFYLTPIEVQFTSGRMIMIGAEGVRRPTFTSVSELKLAHRHHQFLSAGGGCQLAAGQKIYEVSFFKLAQQVPFGLVLSLCYIFPFIKRRWTELRILKRILCETLLVSIGNLLGVIIFWWGCVFPKGQFQ